MSTLKEFLRFKEGIIGKKRKFLRHKCFGLLTMINKVELKIVLETKNYAFWHKKTINAYSSCTKAGWIF